jgi:hypothetical protein
VNSFRGADSSQIAIPLVTEHKPVRETTFYTSGDCGATAVSGFDGIEIPVIVCKHCASRRRDRKRFVCQVHFFDKLCDKPVNYAVTASRAIMKAIVFEVLGPAIKQLHRARSFRMLW